MISKSKINLREYTCTTELVKQVNDPGQWILVLDSHFSYTTKCDTVENGLTEHASEGNLGG
jgi:hypothetical protein